MNSGKTKLIAIIAVLAVVIAGVAVVAFSGNDSEEKKGLYKLDADVAIVSMGQCSATPSVNITLDTIYKAYYGKYSSTKYTLADAQADTEFWNEYCAWTPIVTDNGNDTLTVKSSTKAKGTEEFVIPKIDKMITMGTMYSETLYFLICEKYGKEPYTKASYCDEVINEMRSFIVGGMNYSYYAENEAVFMSKCIPQEGYLDLKVNSVQKLEAETLTQVVRDADPVNNNVIYMASGSRISSDAYYTNNTAPCFTNGAYCAFFAPETFRDVCGCIDAIGKILGYDQGLINGLIEKFQLKLFTIYKSVQEKGSDVKPVAYWESGNGTAVKSAMGIKILQFLGFDTHLMDGAEHDLESLLAEKPSLIVFYDNDSRSMNEKMRVTSKVTSS